MINREKGRNLRKKLMVVLVAGVVTVQVLPTPQFGVTAMAEELSEEELAEAEAAAQAQAEAEAEAAAKAQAEAEAEAAAKAQAEAEAAAQAQAEAEAEAAAKEQSESGTTDADKNGEDEGNSEDPSDADNEQATDEATDVDEAAEADEDAAADEADAADEEVVADEADAADEEVVVDEDAATDDLAEAAVTEAMDTEPAEVQAEEPIAPAINNTETFDQGTTWYPTPTGEVVPSPVIYHGFRFWTIAKDHAFAAQDLNITEEKDASSRTIGTLAKNGLCYILKDGGDWLYVESGSVRGFVPADQLLTGDEAQVLLKEYQQTAASWKEDYDVDADIDNVVSMAHEVISKEDNAAFDYYRATVYQTVVEKDYALPAMDMVNIREGASDDARIVGVLASNALAFVITDKDEAWVYVESGDVRGFVKRDQLVMSETVSDTSILAKDESEYETASESVEPEDNAALYYTITSTQSGVPDGMLRNSILQYAAQFIGNPYVWGGTSLTNGADCSGFVQSIYAQYGYNLPRTAAEQSQVGTQIAVEDAQPGDLIFYGNGGSIYHVVIYAGDGKTIEAKGRQYGIVASEVSYGNAVWAVRVIDEQSAVRYEIPEGLGSIHTYMGWQKVTNPRTQQYAFREAAGMTFDSEGFAVVDNRYVIACTSTFGNIGDYVDFYQEDGTVIPCIIGDFKNQNDAGCNVYGHLNGDCIVEFVVDMNSWYEFGHANPGTDACHPEWNQNIVKVENVGSFYD